jgi:hypothetical protein
VSCSRIAAEIPNRDSSVSCSRSGAEIRAHVSRLERSRRANWKHGHFSREAKAERSRVRVAILTLRYLRDSPTGPGGSCPHGYLASGSYCVPTQGAQDAVPKPPNGSCPWGVARERKLLSARGQRAALKGAWLVSTPVDGPEGRDFTPASQPPSPGQV